MNEFRFGGVQALIIIATVIAFFGAAKLAALSTPDNPVSRTWLTVF